MWIFYKDNGNKTEKWKEKHNEQNNKNKTKRNKQI